MPLYVVSSTDLKNLLSNAWWALKLIWSTNAPLTAGLAAASLARGIVPAGLALFARGLINVFVSEGGAKPVTMDAVLPWFLVGFGVTLLEAIAPLAQRFCTERLHDDVNIRITSDILSHAEKLDLAFFENAEKRDLLDRAQQNPAEPFMRFVVEIQNSATNLLQTVSLATLLALIEPLVLLALAPFALPYLLFHWRLSKKRFQEEYRRTPQRRCVERGRPVKEVSRSYFAGQQTGENEFFLFSGCFSRRPGICVGWMRSEIPGYYLFTTFTVQFGISVRMFGPSCAAQFGVPRLLNRTFPMHQFTMVGKDFGR
jgi:ABC-type multidrug transport system fused ATPase/permease subunit